MIISKIYTEIKKLNIKIPNNTNKNWGVQTEISRSKSGAEGERAKAGSSGPRGVHPHTETVGMFCRELTKASWPGSKKAWVKTGLAEHSGQ